MNYIQRSDLGMRASDGLRGVIKLNRIGLYSIKQKSKLKENDPNRVYWQQTFKIVSNIGIKLSSVSSSAMVGSLIGRIPHNPLFDEDDLFNLDEYKTR